MSAVEVIVWVLVGGGLLGLAIVVLGLLLFAIVTINELWKRFRG
jgi:hypothetical protein